MGISKPNPPPSLCQREEATSSSPFLKGGISKVFTEPAGKGFLSRSPGSQVLNCNCGIRFWSIQRIAIYFQKYGGNG